MNIITFNKHLDLQFMKSTGPLLFKVSPERHYVFGRPQLIRFSSSPEFNQGIYKQSLLDPRIENFVVNHKHLGESVLLYNGCGGYGDQIMTWPVGKILHDHGYVVHILSDPGNAECWFNFPWVSSISVLPIDLSVFKLFKHHAMFEVVANMDQHTPQSHQVDTMLSKIGLHGVIDAQKVVRPEFCQEELAAADSIIAGRKIGIYQLTAASRVRSFTPDESIWHLSRLAEAYPDIVWFAIYDGGGHSSVFSNMLKEHPANIVPYICPSLRVLWAMISKAVLCVGPDSMIVHVAGSLGIPCVGLWGPIGPETRAKYYKNHFPIFQRQACVHSPCHSYTSSFPSYCPSLNMPQCAVLSAISSEMIIAAAGSAKECYESRL